MHQPIDKPVVVIGYGNTLRGDDAVGRLVVERVVKREGDNVVAVSVTQLVPELVPLIAQARAVIFVDACVTATAQHVKLQKLKGKDRQPAIAHHAGPGELLSLAHTCYAEAPPAWLVTVPAAEFELSDKVSQAAQQNVELATLVIEGLIAEMLEHEVIHA